MELRQLGSSDLRVSVVGLGGNNFGWKADAAGPRAIIDRAAACGGSYFAMVMLGTPLRETSVTVIWKS